MKEKTEAQLLNIFTRRLRDLSERKLDGLAYEDMSHLLENTIWTLIGDVKPLLADQFNNEGSNPATPLLG